MSIAPDPSDQTGTHAEPTDDDVIVLDENERPWWRRDDGFWVSTGGFGQTWSEITDRYGAQAYVPASRLSAEQERAERAEAQVAAAQAAIAVCYVGDSVADDAFAAVLDALAAATPERQQ